jgi:UrcA family protein
MIRIVLPAALVIAAIAADAQAQSAQAFYSPSVVSQTVRYRDLDTSTAEGAHRPAFRIRTAARSVCGGDNAVFRMGLAFDHCVQQAIERAADSLDNPLVSQALNLPTSGSQYAHR